MMVGTSEYAYSLLRTEAPSLGSMRVRDSDVSVEAGTVLHAIDTEGLLHLLVPLDSAEEPEPDERSAGVQLVPITLSGGREPRRYLDVACRLPHLDPLFCEVADEMLEAMRNDPARPALACRAVLDRWRELLERRRSSLLGPEQLMGLLGELLVLEQLSARNAASALAMWKGPHGHRFDFVSGNSALEVKASSSREGRYVEIHGDRQLEALAGGELHLIFMRFESRDGSGETVPGVIDRIVAGGVPRLALLETLERVGYSASDRGVYERFGVDVVEQLTYFVDDTFPRIIPASFVGGSLPAGVSHLRYKVDLSGPTPAPLDPASATALFDQFTTGS